MDGFPEFSSVLEFKNTCSDLLFQQIHNARKNTFELVGTFLKVHQSSKDLLLQRLRRNPPDVRVTNGQNPSTKIIYIVLQTPVRLF